jgi:hypothetical protein
VVDTQVQKDTSKPDGEACNDDGTLKDASQMDWINSPSDATTAPVLKHLLDSDDESDDDEEMSLPRKTKKPRVSQPPMTDHKALILTFSTDVGHRPIR